MPISIPQTAHQGCGFEFLCRTAADTTHQHLDSVKKRNCATVTKRKQNSKQCTFLYSITKIHQHKCLLQIHGARSNILSCSVLLFTCLLPSTHLHLLFCESMLIIEKLKSRCSHLTHHIQVNICTSARSNVTELRVNICVNIYIIHITVRKFWVCNLYVFFF